MEEGIEEGLREAFSAVETLDLRQVWLLATGVVVHRTLKLKKIQTI